MDRSSLTTITFLALRCVQLEDELLRLRNLATVDPLTGLYNRRKLEDYLPRVLSSASRRGSPVSFLMLDLDNFKNTNDDLGHKKGDEILFKLAQYLKKVLRASDMSFRYGGDEFVVILPDTDLKWAGIAAVRIAKKVRRAHIKLSIGIGTTLDRADKALYQAKEAGRNCIRVYEEK